MGKPPEPKLVIETNCTHDKKSYLSQKLNQPFEQVVTIGVAIIIGKQIHHETWMARYVTKGF